MDKFKKAFKNGANIGYLVAGYPSLEYTKEFLKVLVMAHLMLPQIEIFSIIMLMDYLSQIF